MLVLDSVDSTNNYAMRLIDADKADHGLTILAGSQSAGRGQRGKSWSGSPGDSVLMSIIVRPGYGLQQQAEFLAAIALAVHAEVRVLVPNGAVRIKWPNDILIGDKKAAGILIENVVRGGAWQWAVVGIGLNTGQSDFPEDLPHATSIFRATGIKPEPEIIATSLRQRILNILEEQDDVLARYNDALYRNGMEGTFRAGSHTFPGQIGGMNESGQLIVHMPGGSVEHYNHGSVEWVWA